MKAHSGIIVLVVIVFLVSLGILSSCESLRSRTSKNVRAMEKEQTPSATMMRVITEKDIESLPPVVRQYLAYSGVVGKVPVQRVRMRQKGRMKTSLAAEWRNFTAEEYYTVNPKSFVWLGTFPIVWPISIQAIDRFSDSHGSLTVRLSPFCTIADSSGNKFDVSEFIRFFNEMTWFPSSLLDPRITWEDLGSSQAKATLHDQGQEASAILSFGPKGELLSWVTDDRYAQIDGKLIKARWTTAMELGDVIEVAGYRIPSSLLIPYFKNGKGVGDHRPAVGISTLYLRAR